MSHRSTTAEDPVCGMTVDVNAAKTTTYRDTTYYFCSSSCQQTFRRDPATALRQAERRVGNVTPAPFNQACVKSEPIAGPIIVTPLADDAAAEDTTAPVGCGSCCHSQSRKPPNPHVDLQAVFTCPMHPEVEQVGPGDCPLCGMDLEPRDVSLDDTGEMDQYLEMKRRFWISGALTLPLMGLAMAPMLWRRSAALLETRCCAWIQAILATAVVFWCGWPILRRGINSFRSRHLNMFSLVTLGSLAAYGLSMVCIMIPSVVPQAFYDNGKPPIYLEAAAVIITLVLLGQVLELRARYQTNGSLRQLMQLTPDTASRVLDDGQVEQVALSEIRPGDRLRVRPGERVPVDGTVVAGNGSIDESMLTGESMPTAKTIGDRVIGGTIHRTGGLELQATGVGQDTVLYRIVRLVSEAQRSRAPIQQLVDTVARYFVPSVILCAIMAFVAWTMFGPPPRLAHAFTAAVAVLVIACPCALGLATPMSVMVGIGRGALEGVLIKNAEVLQVMPKVDTIVVDKTGTLTVGQPHVAVIKTLGDHRESDVLRFAAAVESLSEHPLGQAIVQQANTRGISIPSAEQFHNEPSGGVRAIVDNHDVQLGSADWLAGYTRDEPSMHSFQELHQTGGATVVGVVIDDSLAAIIAIVDPIKPTTKSALASLKNAAIRVVMLTGDAQGTAQSIAEQVEMEEFQARMSPENKLAYVRRLQQAGHTVAVVGDGVNDAPALAAADVGIAMGTGTDAAIESAGITLVSGDLQGLVTARRLSQNTLKNIRQNLFFAFFYNMLGIPIAAGLLYPACGYMLNPMIAAAAMSLSSVTVIVNALRLRTTPLGSPSSPTDKAATAPHRRTTGREADASPD